MFRLVALLLALFLPFAALAQDEPEPPQEDFLAVAQRMGALLDQQACPLTSVLCLEGRLSVIDSIVDPLILSPACDETPVLSYCVEPAAALFRRYLTNRSQLMAAGVDLLPGSADKRFETLSNAALDAVSAPCSWGETFCIDARLAVLAGLETRLASAACVGPDSTAPCPAGMTALHKRADNAAVQQMDALTRAGIWPDPEEYGVAANGHAWLLLDRAVSQPDLLKRAEMVIRASASQGIADRAKLPSLTDRVALGDGKPQPFGTQGACQDGHWKSKAVESLAQVEVNRLEARLETYSAFLAQRESDCAKGDTPRN